MRLGRTPSTAGTFRKKFRKNSGKTPETLSERFLEFPSRVRLGCPKPHNSRHLRLPERFQNSLPPSTAGDASFFRIGSREGLSELVMEFPAVLGVFLRGYRHYFIRSALSDKCTVSLGQCLLIIISHAEELHTETETDRQQRRLAGCAPLGCRKWGCNKWGLKGCLAALPGNRPKSAFFALFLPFSPFPRGCEEHLENPENGGKRPFSSDILRFA